MLEQEQAQESENYPQRLLKQKASIENATPEELQVMLDEYNSIPNGTWMPSPTGGMPYPKNACIDWLPWAIGQAMRGESLACEWSDG